MTTSERSDSVERDQFWIETILSASPDGTLVVDEAGRITHANLLIEDFLGWQPHELLGQKVELLLPESLRERHEEYVRAFFRAPHPVAIGLRSDLYARHRKGHEVPVEVGLNPIVLQGHTMVLVFVRDISNRVQNYNRLELVLESAPIAILMIDAARRIVMVNSLLEEIFGYEREECLGQTVELLIPSRFRELHPELVAAFFQKPEHRRMGVGREVFGRRKNGDEFACELALSPVRLGDQLFVLAALADISERQRMEREFSAAREIQQAMLPEHSPQLDGYNIAGLSRPANATGGDFFDYLRLATGDTAIIIGDVSGHGFGPALLSATTKSYLKALTSTHEDLETSIYATNNLLVEETLPEQFVTLLTVVLCSQLNSSRYLQYIGAGHESFVFDHDGGLKHVMRSDGLPLGLVADQSYRLSDAIPLDPGDIVVVITDGVLECRSPEGEIFGKQRLFDLIKSSCDLDTEGILEALFRATTDFRGAQPQTDDVTAVVIKVIR